MPRPSKATVKSKHRRAKDIASRKPANQDGCIIPGPVPIGVLRESVLKRNDRQAESIREYVEWQSKRDKERVSHLEKVATEYVFERKLDVWDVRTNRSRYWVITNPTNLYSQKLFPSMDYTLSFHVGVTLRAWAMQKGAADDQQQDRLASAWRRWGQATDALDRADEADDFQAVGMRCRECLLAMIRAIAKPGIVPTGQDVPKAADFVHWSEFIADATASGPGAKELRGYLKAVGRAAWQLVSLAYSRIWCCAVRCCNGRRGDPEHTRSLRCHADPI